MIFSREEVFDSPTKKFPSEGGTGPWVDIEGTRVYTDHLFFGNNVANVCINGNYYFIRRPSGPRAWTLPITVEPANGRTRGASFNQFLVEPL
jgi:hypothetical protein